MGPEDEAIVHVESASDVQDALDPETEITEAATSERSYDEE